MIRYGGEALYGPTKPVLPKGGNEMPPTPVFLQKIFAGKR